MIKVEFFRYSRFSDRDSCSLRVLEPSHSTHINPLAAFPAKTIEGAEYWLAIFEEEEFRSPGNAVEIWRCAGDDRVHIAWYEDIDDNDEDKFFSADVSVWKDLLTDLKAFMQSDHDTETRSY